MSRSICDIRAFGDKPLRFGFALFLFAFSSPALTQSFNDITAQVGIQAPHTATYLITGQGWADVNRDGRVDLFVTNNAGPNKLFLQTEDHQFVESDDYPELVLADEQSGGVAFADYDNDGDQDLFIASFGPNHLFRNMGAAGFVEVTDQAGLSHIGRGESAAWGDYNNDGLLDLYMTGFPIPDHPDWDDPNNHDALYTNNGDGTFTKVNQYLNPDRTRGPGFAVTFLDYDNDNDQDIYVVNDKLWGNLLWRNDGPGCSGWCFTDVSIQTGAHRPVYGMGIAVGDYDNDGDFDLYFSSQWEQVLLRNQIAQGMERFDDVSATAGVDLNAIGWATIFLDYDNDGWQDMYLATYSNDPLSSDRLYKNLQDGTFADVSQSSGVSNLQPTIGAAIADYNKDGRVDLIVGDHDHSFRLYYNDDASQNNWLQLRLNGAEVVNRDALGTRVEVTANGQTQTQSLLGGRSIGASHEKFLHFGLGDAAEAQVRLIWPDGHQQNVVLAANQSHKLSHPSSNIVFNSGFEFAD